MTAQDPPTTVTLAPPGAGMGWLPRQIARLLLRRYANKYSADKAMALFRREGERLRAIAVLLKAEQLAERVLVPKIAGLEDSSRYWSVAMTLEHLVIVNKAFASYVVTLSKGKVPPGVVDIAEVKPHASVDPEAIIAAFAACLDDFEARVATRTRPMSTRARYAHPWFGPLNAHAWLCLAALHQRIHRRQAEEICDGLGYEGPQVIEQLRAKA